MTTSSRKLTTAAAIAAIVGQSFIGSILSSTANAADMLADEVEEYTDVEFGTGWYIRGDIALTTTGGLFNTDTSEPIPGTSILQVTTTDEESLLGGGVAVGYRLNDNFRVDLGLESLGTSTVTSFATTTNYRPPCSNAFIQTLQADPLNPLGGQIIVVQPGHTITNCIEESSSSYSLAQLGPSVFYDFDSTFLGARPFVGAGFGFARNAYTSESGTITCTAAAEERCNPTDGGIADFGESYRQVGSRNNGTSYHLTTSLSAGLSFKVAENLFIDSSYRYTHMFGTPIFGGNNGLAAAGAPTSMHSVKLGLRYEIW